MSVVNVKLVSLESIKNTIIADWLYINRDFTLNC